MKDAKEYRNKKRNGDEKVRNEEIGMGCEADVSRECTASVFRVETSKKQAKPSLFFDPDYGGITFLRNGGEPLPHYTASRPRKQYSS
jgi:hypothetical protein